MQQKIKKKEINMKECLPTVMKMTDNFIRTFFG
jgi:hypothetical protein